MKQTTAHNELKPTGEEFLRAETERIRKTSLRGIKNIPQELRALPSWVVYKLEPRKEKDGRVKMGKPPANPTTGRNVSPNSPESFITFDRAVSALRANKPGNLAGIGLAMVKGSGLVGIDLDDALNPDGSPLPWASAILDRVPGYCEVSPSGRGLRVFGRGTLPENGGKHPVRPNPNISVTRCKQPLGTFVEANSTR
ncbi:MAG: hypothetical protein Q8O19_03035 [Rectinemataceae bacterium]|nr:hypothetical protein [Rectinemataceae bacterium]